MKCLTAFVIILISFSSVNNKKSSYLKQEKFDPTSMIFDANTTIGKEEDRKVLIYIKCPANRKCMLVFVSSRFTTNSTTLIHLAMAAGR
jgi:hypothetical protein